MTILKKKKKNLLNCILLKGEYMRIISKLTQKGPLRLTLLDHSYWGGAVSKGCDVKSWSGSSNPSQTFKQCSPGQYFHCNLTRNHKPGSPSQFWIPDSRKLWKTINIYCIKSLSYGVVMEQYIIKNWQ